MSDERFSADPFAFSELNSSGIYKFKQDGYLHWIDDRFANDLHISKKTTVRAGGTRKPFQAEFSLLKKLGFINGSSRRTGYRIGVGLEINWPKVMNSMMYFSSL